MITAAHCVMVWDDGEQLPEVLDAAHITLWLGVDNKISMTENTRARFVFLPFTFNTLLSGDSLLSSHSNDVALLKLRKS